MRYLRYKLTRFLQNRGMEVCLRLGKFLGMRADKVRVLFIYFNFFSLGIAFFIYLLMACALFVKDIFWIKRPSVFDL